MKIGLLLCEHINDEFRDVHGDYPDMFYALMPDVHFKVYPICDGIFPESALECDAWMTNGSRYSVYQEIDWIMRLKAFVKAIELSDQ